jgi:hypothetical protein
MHRRKRQDPGRKHEKCGRARKAIVVATGEYSTTGPLRPMREKFHEAGFGGKNPSIGEKSGRNDFATTTTDQS